MNHADIVFYLSNLLDSKTLSLFKLSNRFIYNISNKVYHRRTPQQHVETLLTYESYEYLYGFDNAINLRRYRCLSIEGFELIESSYRIVYTNKFLRVTILNTQLHIDSKMLLTDNDLNAILNTFKLPSVYLQGKRPFMGKHNVKKKSIPKKYKKYYRKCECRNHLTIFDEHYENIYDICKKLL